MKAYVTLPLSVIVIPLSVIFFSVFFLTLLLFTLTEISNYKHVSIPQVSVTQVHAANTVSLGLPARLTIPAINVNAAIQDLGVTPKGDMDVPANTTDVGWFKLGPRPGERGSAVIAGHFDGTSGEPGVFTNLNKLKKGDKLYVIDDKGTSVKFIVRESRTYDPGYAEEVFSSNDGTHLNLVTCDGVWDGTKKSYSKRLVVFADISQ